VLLLLKFHSFFGRYTYIPSPPTLPTEYLQSIDITFGMGLFYCKSMLVNWRRKLPGNLGGAHFLIMLISLVVLLGMIATQSQTSRYISSNTAILKSLGLTDLTYVSSVDSFWLWLQNLEKSLGGETASDVAANCEGFVNNAEVKTSQAIMCC
jgi:hypothetical protein